MLSANLLGFFVLALFGTPVGAMRDDGSARGTYTLNLHPPEEDKTDVKASLDAIMKAERVKGLKSDEAFSAEKERMLAAEKAELAAIVQEAFKPLFGGVSGSVLRPASLSARGGPTAQNVGHVLQLHPPEEQTADVKASLDAIMNAERAKARESEKTFSAERQRMLSAEKVELAAIVREAFTPFMHALGHRGSSVGGARVDASRQASFLSSGIIPVDPALISEGLELTQPLRAPPQATVNVVEREDTNAMAEQAKYAGMLDQAERLMADYRNDLYMLGQRAA